MNSQDYHFYDIDEKQTEARHLLDHAGDFDSQQTTNKFLAFLSGGLATVLLLVSAVMGWLLFSTNTGNTINLSHAIICTMALFFAGFGAFFAFLVWKDQRDSAIINPNVSFVLWIGSIGFIVYFSIAALYLWVNQQFFSNYIKCTNSIVDLWQQKFWGMDYNATQLGFWRMYFTLAIFSITIAICFAHLAHLSWTQLINKVQSKNIALGISLLSVFLFGFLSLIWYLNNNAAYYYIQQKLPKHFAYVPFIAFIFAIIGLCFALLNAISNFIKAKSLNFVWAVFWTMFFLVFAIFVALLFKDAYNLSKHNAFNRHDAAGFTHKSNYGQYCSSKYLDAGQFCGSSYNTFAWDDTPSISATLNPACDCNSTDLMLWSWLILSIMCAFLLASAAIATITNFALASSERDDGEYNTFAIFDVVVLLIIILLIVSLGFWLIFRLAPITNAYQLPSSGLTTNLYGKLVANQSFASVPTEVSQNIPVDDQCYFLSKANLPQFEPPKSENDGYSVGVLVKHGKINTNHVGSLASIGSKNSRQYYFPDANNLSDDFVNIYGNPAAVTNALRNLVICQTALHVNHGVYVNSIAINLSKLSNNGLTNGVSPVYIEPYTTGSSPDLSAYTNPAGPCVRSCTYSLTKPTDGHINIKGILLIKNAAGQSATYGTPEANLVITLYQNQNGQQKYIAFGSYDGYGNFLIVAPFIQNAAYKAVIHIDDPSKQYQSNLIDVIIAPPAPNTDMLVGNVYLTTLSGEGCKQAEFAATLNCFSNQSAKNVKLTLNIQEMLSPGENMHYPLTVTIRKSFSELGGIVATQTLNSPTWTQILPVGYYSAQISGPNYEDKVHLINLDREKIEVAYLEEKTDGGYKIYAAIDNSLDPTSDFDLNLKIRAKDGSECVVSPSHKICPSATHIQSVSQNRKGFEVIQLDKFSNAYYMVYVTKGSAIPSNCTYSNTTAQHFSAKRNNHLANVVANSAVQVFTALPNSLSSSGPGQASSYVESTNETFNPIKYGIQTVVPNLLAAVGTHGNPPSADLLFSKTVANQLDAKAFGQSFVLVYSGSQSNAQKDKIINNKNANSEFVSKFKSYWNDGSKDQTSSQTFVTNYLTDIVQTSNANANQRIRESNNLPAGVNFYDVFESGQNSIFNQPFADSTMSPDSSDNEPNQNTVIVSSTPSETEISEETVESQPLKNIEVESSVEPNEPGDEDTVTMVPDDSSNGETREIPIEDGTETDTVDTNNTEAIYENSNQISDTEASETQTITDSVSEATVNPKEEVPSDSSATLSNDIPLPSTDNNETAANGDAANSTVSTIDGLDANESDANENNADDITEPTQYESENIEETQDSGPDGNKTESDVNIEEITTSQNIITPASVQSEILLENTNNIITSQNNEQTLNSDTMEQADEDENEPLVSEIIRQEVDVVQSSDENYDSLLNFNNGVNQKVIKLDENKKYPLDTDMIPYINTNTPAMAPQTTTENPQSTTDNNTQTEAVAMSPTSDLNETPFASEPTDQTPSNAGNNVSAVSEVRENVENQVNEDSDGYEEQPTASDNESITQAVDLSDMQIEQTTPEKVNQEQENEAANAQENNETAEQSSTETEDETTVKEVVNNPTNLQQVVVQNTPASEENKQAIEETAPENQENPEYQETSDEIKSTESVDADDSRNTTSEEVPINEVEKPESIEAVASEIKPAEEAPVEEQNTALTEAEIEEPQPTATPLRVDSSEAQEAELVEQPLTLDNSVPESAVKFAEKVVDTVVDGTETLARPITADEDAQIIPDRRLKTGRLLQAVASTYQTQFCFTGFGEKSIKPINLSGSGTPSIQPCVNLYSDSDSYSLKNLNITED